MPDQTLPTPREIHNEPWRLLATLPSTNWKTVSGSVLTWVTCAQYFALQWAGRDAKIIPGLWDSWLLFVGSLVGITAAQYAWKRKTYDPSGPEAQRAAASEPGAAAEAVRARGAAADVVKAAAEGGGPALVAPLGLTMMDPAVVAPAGMEPATTLAALNEAARRRSLATFDPSGERGAVAPPPPPAGLARPDQIPGPSIPGEGD
jgi:hypothetical protein